MEIHVATADRLFFSAAEGVAGAMGHRALQVDSLDGAGTGFVVVDLGTAAFRLGDIVDHADPLRLAVFVPASRPDLATAARASGILYALARTSLATELPRILAAFATEAE